MIGELDGDRERSLRALLSGRWTVGRVNEGTDTRYCRMNQNRARLLVKLGLAQSPYSDGSLRPVEDVFFGEPLEISEAGRAYLAAREEGAP